MSAGARAAGGGPVVDVGDADFEREVLARSDETPVVVDFWAPWCGPCRTLGPVLEALAQEHGGAFVLAKVNVDEAPRVAQAFDVRSIPAVIAFREGAIVAQFVGAQPEPVVREFLGRVLPSEADQLAVEGDGLAAADPDTAEARYRSALEKDPRQSRALVGLARLLAARGEDEEALDLLQRVVPTTRWAAEADHLAAEIRTASESDVDIAPLRARLEANPNDLAARLELGRALAAQRAYESALTELLAVVRSDPDFEDQAARKAMIDLFELLGAEHELTHRFRSDLARALYR